MQTEHLAVTGMTCGGCAGAVTRALRAVAGVIDVDVSVDAAVATIRFDEAVTSSDRLVSAVEGAGYGVSGTRPARAPRGGGCCCR